MDWPALIGLGRQRRDLLRSDWLCTRCSETIGRIVINTRFLMGLLTRQNCSSSTTASKPGTSPTRCMSTLSDNVRRRRHPVRVTVLGHSRIGRRSHERTFVDLGYPRTPGPTISSNLRPQQNVNRTTLSNADFKAYSRPERELTEYASMTIFIKPEVPLRIATPSEEDRTTAIGNMDRKFR